MADYSETYSRMTYDQFGAFDTGSSIGAGSSFSQDQWATGYIRRRIDRWLEQQDQECRVEQDRRAKGYQFWGSLLWDQGLAMVGGMMNPVVSVHCGQFGDKTMSASPIARQLTRIDCRCLI